jgi:hypothetical protein
MALFNLTDIKFKRETRGRLNRIVDTQYPTDILKYPIDIGTNYDKGHYMVIYINQQEQSSEDFKRGEFGAEEPSILRISKEIGKRRSVVNQSQLLGATLDKVTKVSQQLGINVDAKTISPELLKGNIFRRIKRTTSAIALYMPDTLNFTYSQSYSDVSTSDVLGLIGTAAAAADAEINQKNISSFLLQFARESNIFGAGGIATLGLAATGTASNPNLELLYSSPSFRSFRFDFMFYPRSQKEAKEVIQIIKKLNFHQAPEISNQAGGRFLIPPSEFDIKFYYDGNENPNIPKVSTCVLETIDVDYAPNGFSAYEVPNANAFEGGTGMPTAIRLSLQFKETQIVTKEFFAATNQANDSDLKSGYYDVKSSSDRIDDR